MVTNSQTTKEYKRIQRRFVNSGLSVQDYLASIKNKNTLRKVTNALKANQIISISKQSKSIEKSTKKSKPIKKSTKKSKSIKKSTKKSKPIKKSTKKSKPIKSKKIVTVTTSKSQQQQIPARNKRFKIWNQNITFNFNPKIDIKEFTNRIPYLMKRIVSNFHSYPFSSQTITLFRSTSIFEDSKGSKVSIGTNSGNEYCKSDKEFARNLFRMFGLIQQTFTDSFLYIEFIDLTITIYKF